MTRHAFCSVALLCTYFMSREGDFKVLRVLFVSPPVRQALTTAEVRCRPFCADETVTCATASPPHSTSNTLENPAADMKANAQKIKIAQIVRISKVAFK
jgi:hypothetical protein